MSFARTRELVRSLSMRLTLWYAGLLLLALVSSYTISYFLVSSLAMRRTETYLQGEAEECSRLYQIQGIASVKEEARTEMQNEGSADIYFRIVGPTGETEFESANDRWKQLVLDIPRESIKTGTPLFAASTRGGDKPNVRIIAYRLSPTQVLFIAVSTNSELLLVRDSMHAILIVMLGIWLVAAAIGLFLARRSLRGIRDVQLVAADFTLGKTQSRVHYPPRGDEVDGLARSFNLMADRIETLLQRLRETNDNLAHELRSPITCIRARCELALTKPGLNTPESESLAVETIEQCDRMLGTISTLLEIAETESGAVKISKKEIDLGELLTGACDIFNSIAEDKKISLSLVLNGPSTVVGDPEKLQRLFSNLLDNALKFTPPGGFVKVQSGVRDQSSVTSITDSGPGIPAHEREIVFERCFRGSAVASQPGNGLGLSLARTVARAHGGDILINGNVPTGAEFIVMLPLKVAANEPESRVVLQTK